MLAGSEPTLISKKNTSCARSVVPDGLTRLDREVGMAYVVMAYVVMAYIAMACIVMASIVMAYIVMAYIAMAYIDDRRCKGAGAPS